MNNNKSIISITVIILLTSLNFLYAQTIQNFSGAYENGTATYQYFETSNYERIFHGSFKYKGNVIDGLKGKLTFTAVGQYNQNKKDGFWTYTLKDPNVKGVTEVVSGNYANGQMEGGWNSVTTVNNTKKTIKKSSAIFKNNKPFGEITYSYTGYTFKEYSAITLKGYFNESGFFDGTWTTDYTQAKIQYQEMRKYRDGVLVWLIHRRMSDGQILDKIDSTLFVDKFFQNYDPAKKISQVGDQKYVLNENPVKYSGLLDIPIVVTNYWSVYNKNAYYTSLTASNPMFLISYGYNPSTAMHEKVIINWLSTTDGQKQSWQSEQDKKIAEEKYQESIIKADTAFNKKLFGEAIALYKTALTFKDVQYAKDQLQKAQIILEEQRILQEQELKAKNKAYQEVIIKADQALADKKYDVAFDLYQSALTIKDDKYPKEKLEFIKQLRNEELRLKVVQEYENLWVNVEAGSFKMGCLRSDIYCVAVEEPVHEAYLDSYLISKYEVTIGQYRAFCKATGRTEPEGIDNLPVANVNWTDAVAFADWLGCRLPTEAEWEYAARGGINNRKTLYSGSNDPDEVAWTYENGLKKAQPVGTKKPNSLGIYDMSGNVWEWCADWYGNYIDESEINPKGPASGTQRIKRGGSFNENNYEVDLRVTNRASEIPSFASYNLGFRLVKK
jgi:sulfatase modifying factor 1